MSGSQMTRQHFVAIAEAIHNLPTTKKNKRQLVESVEQVFADSNPQFDPYRFREAALS